MDAFRAAGRYLGAHRLAFALEERGKQAGIREWENICRAVQLPAAFGPQRYKVHLQQHAAVIITALRRKDADRPCDVAGRPLPAGARPSSVDSAEQPSVASSVRSRRRGASKGGSKPQDAPRPAALQDAAAAQARAQAAMDELLLEEVGGQIPHRTRPPLRCLHSHTLPPLFSQLRLACALCPKRYSHFMTIYLLSSQGFLSRCAFAQAD